MQSADAFNAHASEYDRYRPTYPVELGPLIATSAGLREGAGILEIGCGTGQATALFADFRPRQLSIDPGPALLARCRARHGHRDGYSFHCSRFEVLDGAVAPAGAFELIYAATCFHWLERGLRFRRAHELLAPGGHLAVFSHRHSRDPGGFFTAVQTIYARLAPELRRREDTTGADDRGEARPFETVLHERIDQELVYDAASYAGLLRTFSDHIALGPARLDGLCQAIAAFIDDAYAGSIRKTLTTELVVYRRP